MSLPTVLIIWSCYVKLYQHNFYYVLCQCNWHYVMLYPGDFISGLLHQYTIAVILHYVNTISVNIMLSQHDGDIIIDITLVCLDMYYS